jgi:hypothetical protein
MYYDILFGFIEITLKLFQSFAQDKTKQILANLETNFEKAN